MGNAEKLAALEERVENELNDALAANASNLVFGKGNPDARVVFIGEAPGKNEDEQGLPFVGRAGEELDKLLHSIGLSAEEVYIANVLKYRPPNNRDPKKQEIQRHTPYLVEQLEIIQPEIVATLGNFATKFVLADFNPENMSSIPGISNLHGQAKPKKISGLQFTAFPLYHPAAMLYNPGLRETLEKDFEKMRGVLTQARLG